MLVNLFSTQPTFHLAKELVKSSYYLGKGSLKNESGYFPDGGEGVDPISDICFLEGKVFIMV